MPTQEEINQKLKEVNMITLARSKQLALDWFRKNKIKTFIMNTTVYVVPQYVDEKELARRLNIVNQSFQMLREQLLWFKKNGLSIIRKKSILGGDIYEYEGEIEGYDPQERIKGEQNEQQQQSTTRKNTD